MTIDVGAGIGFALFATTTGGLAHLIDRRLDRRLLARPTHLVSTTRQDTQGRQARTAPRRSGPASRL